MSPGTESFVSKFLVFSVISNKIKTNQFQYKCVYGTNTLTDAHKHVNKKGRQLCIENSRNRLIIAKSSSFFFLLKATPIFKGPMTASTHRTVLSLYMRVFRIARSWQAQSGIPGDTDIERKYILQEARTLFRQNQQVGTATA